MVSVLYQLLHVHEITILTRIFHILIGQIPATSMRGLAIASEKREDVHVLI